MSGNIYFGKGYYQISHNNHYFCSVKDKELAIAVRDYLQGHDWIIPLHEPTILFLQGKYHIVNNINNKIKLYSSFNTREEAEQELKQGYDYTNLVGPSKRGDYSVFHARKYYGNYQDQITAMDIRDYLVKHDWVIPFNEPTIIKSNKRYYIVDEMEGKLKVYSSATTLNDAEKELNNLDDMTNIYYTNNYYLINRVHDGKKDNYYTYKTKEEAKSMRDFLREHNWNRGEFEEEYNKRYPKLPEYIYRTGNRYFIKKRYAEGFQRYGVYNTIDEAVRHRDWLIANDWKVPVKRGIIEYNGYWYVRRNTLINRKPYKKFYYKTESKDEAIKVYLDYKMNGYPEPVYITDKYRYIHHDGQLYYVVKSPTKYGYTKTLEDAIILRTIIENTGWKKPVEGIYIYDGTMYKIKYNNYGTPVFEKEIDAQYIRENKEE